MQYYGQLNWHILEVSNMGQLPTCNTMFKCQKWDKYQCLHSKNRAYFENKVNLGSHNLKSNYIVV